LFFRGGILVTAWPGVGATGSTVEAHREEVSTMKRSQVFLLAAALAVGGLLGASAATSQPRGPTTVGAGAMRVTIGSAPPAARAAARMRAPGLEDEDGPESDDGGGAAVRGRVAHGTIGVRAPSSGAAARLRALGQDD
jgi:hypothetical protein